MIDTDLLDWIVVAEAFPVKEEVWPKPPVWE